MSIFLIILPHIAILIYLFNRYASAQKSPLLWQILIIFEVILFAAFIWLKLNISPFPKDKADSFRLRILIGGRRLVLYSLFAGAVQIIIYCFSVPLVSLFKIPTYIFVINIIVTVLFIVLLYFNGMLRILFTSRRLNIIKKVVIASTMYIPFVNIFEILYLSSNAKSEYEHECYKVASSNMRIDSLVCKTKYPLVLIHGVGFKDFKYINYWGRIPKELIKNGATIYYGNQEAWGTIEYNAQDIKNKIFEVVKETGCKKVNIIAHSKGGLDSRYMISKLDMADYVASITMISTPHRGTKLIDIIYKMPKGLLKLIGLGFYKYFKMIGDKNPDFFAATRQLSIDYCREFNETVKDAPQVYYQSYTSKMNNLFSDYILTIPYIILKLADGENDGLVSIESSMWGNFRGVLKNRYNRGISHGDIIDLRKNEYKGFDVREQYVRIVEDLKNKGF
jgi:triacylglycerol lipase